METTMKTTFHILSADGTKETREVDWPVAPIYAQLHDLLLPLLGEGEPLEHVAVLHEGHRADMFVSELGHLPMKWRGPMPRNEQATTIYRNNTMVRSPNTDPETLSWIAGPAILFDRIVWR